MLVLVLEEFLHCVGHKVILKNFEGYRGGLDTIHGQTGLESLYTQYHGRELMFHVSTMLPYTEGDHQQVIDTEILILSCCISRLPYADSVAQDQPAHPCSLI